LLGTVTQREEVIAPPVRRHWRVTVEVDRVLFGSLTTPTFTFAMDGPMWEPPRVGRRYRVATGEQERPDAFAETAPLLDERASARAQPFTGAVGNASPLPDDDKNASAIMVAFGTRNAPPKRDVLVTLVAADPGMPATSTRFGCAEHDEHGNETAVHLEPVTTPEWIARQRAAVEIGRSYPRVMILPGDLPAARALEPGTIARATLPKGTRLQSLIAAVDADGDGRPDFVARRACQKGSTCEETLCEEVWAAAAGKWRRRDRSCGD
jgi:hypothetical protein